ncbi:MAG TPA: sigma-70 family RNA polymerase sigma factor [Longimicrobiales bacterium]|nr:sigma-70 family RNA polymerase sigma factor [Longimicrobiales bacterium]
MWMDEAELQSRKNRGRSVPAQADLTDVRRAARGDHEAFERLYRSQVGRVHALARRMVGDDVAEDLTQEVFIRAWEKLGSFRGEAKFGTWLHRLAVNHLLTRRETLRRREARTASGEGILERLTAPLKRSSAAALDLEVAMGRLPEGAKQVFVLYDVEGYGHDDIAEFMNISVGTSKSQLHRARMLLRGYLER